MRACFAQCFLSVKSYSLSGTVSPGLFRSAWPHQCFPAVQKILFCACMLKHLSSKNACPKMLVLLGHIKHRWELWDLEVYFNKLLLKAGVSSWISIFLLIACIASEETLREKITPLQLQHQKENKSLSVKRMTFWSPIVILKKDSKS